MLLSGTPDPILPGTHRPRSTLGGGGRSTPPVVPSDPEPSFRKPPMRMRFLALSLIVLAAPAARAQTMSDSMHHAKPMMMDHGRMMSDTGMMAHQKMMCDSTMMAHHKMMMRDSAMAGHGGMMGDSAMMAHHKMMGDSGMMGDSAMMAHHKMMMRDSTMMGGEGMDCGHPMMGRGGMMHDSTSHAPMPAGQHRRSARPTGH